MRAAGGIGWLAASVALSWLCSGAPARASETLRAVVIPSAASAAPDAARVAAALRSLPGVVDGEPVFDEGERRYLAAAGMADIAASARITLRDAETRERLRKWLKLGRDPAGAARARGIFPAAAPLAGRLEANARVTAVEALVPAPRPNPEQWGLRNTGANQEVEITDILARVIQGRAGEDVGAEGAPAERPGRKVLVAVVDTGVEVAHPALRDAIHRTASECEALAAYRECMRTSADKEPCHARFANLDADGNGYPLDCQGWNVLGANGRKDPRTGIRGDNDPADDIGHGTHVSGIVAAAGLVSGVAARSAEILPVRVMGRGESIARAEEGEPLPDPRSAELVADGTFADTVARGVLYATRSGARIINLSLGYSIHEDSELMRRMVALAQARGVLVVAAAGNQSSRVPVYPCRYSGVVCVASFSADGSISHFSDFGDAVDLAAPGHKILSSWPTKLYPSFHTERRGYDFKSGTSMASPFVAGSLARLLNAGVGPAEAFARLLVGARPHRPPTAMPELSPKYTLTGNVDLARAFGAVPRPLILPALKEPVLVALERGQAPRFASAPFSVPLRNAWAHASRVVVEASLDPRAGLRFAGGNRTVRAEFADWSPGETRKLEAALSFEAVPSLLELPGDFVLELRITVPGDPEPRVIRKSVEFVVPVRPLGSDDETPQKVAFTRIATDLKSSALPGDYALKPVGCLPVADPAVSPRGSVGEDLLLIGKTPRFTQLTLLAGSRSGDRRALSKAAGGAILDVTKEKLLAFSCLDRDGDGARDYAVSALNTADKKIVFTLHDGAFRRGSKLEFSSETVALAEDFRWLAGVDASGLAPAWIARGKLPKAEAPAFDPWENRAPEVVNAPDMRLYVLGADGLRTVKAPEGYRYVGMLRPSLSELRDGTARVLLYKGQDYLLDFYVAPLNGQRGKAGLAFGVPQPVGFTIYHRVAGLKTLPVLGGGDGSSGTAFLEESSSGRMRLSLLGGDRQLRPLLLEPLKDGDSIESVLGVFGDLAQGGQSGSRTSAFFRSRFEMYFRDGASGQTVATDLRQYDSVTRHLPVWTGGGPALLMAEGQGGGLATEILLPARSAGTGDLSLTRPAAFKTLGVGGCELIQMLSTSQGGAGGGLHELPGSLIYFCGNHFVRVAL